MIEKLELPIIFIDLETIKEGMMVDNILLIDDVMDSLSDILSNIAVFYVTSDHCGDQSYINICNKHYRLNRINILAGAGFEFGSKSFLSFATTVLRIMFTLINFLQMWLFLWKELGNYIEKMGKHKQQLIF